MRAWQGVGRALQLAARVPPARVTGDRAIGSSLTFTREVRMQKSSTGAGKARPLRRRVRPSWSTFTFVLILLALALKADRAAAAMAEVPTCESAMGRACTAMEELWFCESNAMTSYDECKERGGLWHDVGRYSFYVVVFYACGFTTPISIILK